MVFASLLVLASGFRGDPPPPVATYKLAGRDIAVTLPTRGEIAETEPTVNVGGWNYLLNHEGTPIGKMRRRGGWAEVSTLYEEAKPKWTAQTPVWHVKVILFTRADVLDKTPDGLLRQRRASLGTKATDAALQDIGRFCVAAEAAAQGDARVVADVELDNDLLMGDGTAGEGNVISKAFIDRVATARTNAGGYEAEDKVYRGPYQSVFVLHPTLTPGLMRSRAFGAPVSSFSVYDSRWLSTPALPEAMLSCWAADLADRIAPSKDMGQVPRLDITDGMSTAMNAAPYVSTILKERAARGGHQAPWAEVSRNPFGMLPRMVLPAPGAGMFVTRYEGVPLLVAPAGMADLAASSDAGITAAAWMVTGGVPYVIFRPSGTLPDSVLDALGIKGKVQHPEALGGAPTLNASLLTPTWNYPTELGQDPQRGRTLTITEASDVRSGHGLLPTEGEAKGTVLRFDVKSTSKDPIAVVVMGSKAPVQIVLGAPDQKPSDSSDDIKTIPLAFKADGTWQTIQVDLKDQAEPGSLLLVAPPNESRLYERRQLDPSTFTFANAAWVAALDGASTPVGSPVPEVVGRALKATTADTKTLLPMLDDRSDLVAMNVAARFQKIRSAEAEPALIRMAGSANPRVSEQAVKALQFQGTESAKTGLRNILDNGAYDQDRMFAAEAVAAENSPNAAGAISRLLAAPSWQAKVRAVELISEMGGTEAKPILITFLLQDSPEVRLTTTELADPQFELACRRMLYGAVNDSSDAVRAASYRQLLRSSIAKYKEEGRKGVGDDSPAVRLAVLAALAEKPAEADRAALQQAVTDKSSAVRAEALRGFARLPGAVQAEEIANVLRDEHADVQLALIGLATAKQVALPAEVVTRLKSSPDPEVAEAAKALPG